MKKSILVLVLFVTVVMGVFAQSSTNYYRCDHMYVNSQSFRVYFRVAQLTQNNNGTITLTIGYIDRNDVDTILLRNGKPGIFGISGPWTYDCTFTSKGQTLSNLDAALSTSNGILALAISQPGNTNIILDLQCR